VWRHGEFKRCWTVWTRSCMILQPAGVSRPSWSASVMTGLSPSHTYGIYHLLDYAEMFYELDDRGRRGHDQKLFKNGFRLDVRKFAFSNRVANDWNSLSSQCVNGCAVNIFLKYLATELKPETAKLR